MSIEVTAAQWRQMREIADERDRYKAECEEWVEAHDKVAAENADLAERLAGAQILNTSLLRFLRKLQTRSIRRKEALAVIAEWCGTDDGYRALPFEPPWYQQLVAALEEE